MAWEIPYTTWLLRTWGRMTCMHVCARVAGCGYMQSLRCVRADETTWNSPQVIDLACIQTQRQRLGIMGFKSCCNNDISFYHVFQTALKPTRNKWWRSFPRNIISHRVFEGRKWICYRRITFSFLASEEIFLFAIKPIPVLRHNLSSVGLLPRG